MDGMCLIYPVLCILAIYTSPDLNHNKLKVHKLHIAEGNNNNVSLSADNWARGKFRVSMTYGWLYLIFCELFYQQFIDRFRCQFIDTFWRLVPMPWPTAGLYLQCFSAPHQLIEPLQTQQLQWVAFSLSPQPHQRHVSLFFPDFKQFIWTRKISTIIFLLNLKFYEYKIIENKKCMVIQNKRYIIITH